VTRLKTVMQDAGIKQGVLAAAAGLSRSALNVFVNRGSLPVGVDREDVERRIAACVKAHGGPTAALFEDPKEDLAMLLRKQSLTSAARRHFNLVKDPFADPVEADDVFLSPDIRYVREAMYQVARHGGFLAVVGESGAGKSTLREELIDRLQREEQSVIVVQPYVLASEGTDLVGKTLRSHHIAESIMAAVAPLAKPKSSPEARFRQLHESLRDSARSGHAHVLIIEEAHSLPLPTLKHLKRFRELKDGLRPLLSVILIGQPELALKLSEHNPEVREVVQRIEIVTLPALDKDLETYLAHRFKRAGTALDKVLAKTALDALRNKLTPTRSSGTLLYPLAVHNALTAAMNRAAELCAPIVDADIVRGA
jgi:type II secretory pathway predicted ATPase ExeA